MNSMVKLEELKNLWSSLIRNFSKKPLDFDFKQVVLTYLGEKRSDTYTHYIHPYPAKMFPYIPVFFFSIPGLCSPEGVVLDPFCGSGTVLLESLINPYYKRNAYGVEINPLGRLITKVKTTPLEGEKLQMRINRIFRMMRKTDNKVSRPESEKVNFWFSKRAIRELGKLRYLIEEEEDDDYKDFLWVCFSSIIRKVSRADPFIPPPVLLRIQKYKNSREKYKILLRFLKQAEYPNVTRLFKDAVEKNFKRIKSLNSIREVKEGRVDAQIIWDDARHIQLGRLSQKGILIKNDAKTLRSNSIDFIFTSPPYLTAQKYIRTHCLELLWLGFTEDEILHLEKEIIGSERVSKEVNYHERIGVRSIDTLIEWAASKSSERSAIVFKYFFEMKQAILELHRILKDESFAILVAGNNKVLGKNVDTYKLLTDLAICSGFIPVLILKDEIRGRGMISKRHDTGGLIGEEFIVVLKKEG